MLRRVAALCSCASAPDVTSVLWADRTAHHHTKLFFYLGFLHTRDRNVANTSSFSRLSFDPPQAFHGAKRWFLLPSFPADFNARGTPEPGLSCLL